MISSTPHSYSDGDTTFIGRLVHDDAVSGQRPGVLIIPAFGGLGSFEIERAEELAALGYVVLAVDYYGEGAQASGPEQAGAWMSALNADRPLVARRITAAFEELRSLPMVDPARIGAMGYCFGGKIALDLARTGADLRAAVSLHGLFDAPPMPRQTMKAAVLACHGWDDPLATPEAVLAFAAEMTETCPDWQLLAFGHTGHAFTNPNANSAGMMYSPAASQRSWDNLTRFFADKLKV
ncbi:dienelactone hydrolase family protein [Pseudodonghicola flavimaris]|uniref:Dienelactone hydrolase family protein n=1 Tax=Pseudodonghicola flavimaris TaxID=3050036 RepID=A0ABT7F2W8_9RHOB|nr:dienelactone hydrolase family protein [Pseudodonghicola flavimaris]MDK3018954.1 dienelactone hydrolase family protein [Pseudodonghicola flavimaris]